jgi:hypothetical protein
VRLFSFPLSRYGANAISRNRLLSKCVLDGDAYAATILPSGLPDKVVGTDTWLASTVWATGGDEYKDR